MQVLPSTIVFNKPFNDTASTTKQTRKTNSHFKLLKQKLKIIKIVMQRDALCYYWCYEGYLKDNVEERGCYDLIYDQLRTS